MVLHPQNYKPRVVFRTTSRCNYRCRMCFWSRPEVAQSLLADDQTMSMELFSRALKEVIPFCSEVSFTDGGEFLSDPFWEERLTELAETLSRNPDIRFNQNTNASLLTADRIKCLRGMKRVGFMISIDSVDPLEYASIRIPGSLGGVLQNIRSLRGNLAALGIDDVRLQLNMVIMKRNVFSIPETLYFAKEINASVVVDHPQGFGPDDIVQESLFNYPVFANDFLDKCQSLAKSLNVAFDRPPPFAISADEVASYFETRTAKSLQCKQLDLYGPISILANGEVSVCCQGLAFGNLNDQPFEEIFLSPNYVKYREAISAGTPLMPCSNCRWLYRSSPYLYDSAVYHMDIPVESRNLDVTPDFENNGFFDWLDELSEKQLRKQLRMAYRYRGKQLQSSGITDKIKTIQQQEILKEKVIRVFQQKAKSAEASLVRWARSQSIIMDNPQILRGVIWNWEFFRRVILRLR